jgi:N-acetylmuramoyl-L-alanine amidase
MLLKKTPPERGSYKTRMKISKYLFILLAGGIYCALTSYNAGGPRPAQHQAVRTIIIDAGHGGFDPGTSGLITTEKEVTLAISLKLGAAIQQAFPNVKIIFTRTTDVMPGIGPTIPPGYTHHSALAFGLNYRAELANKSKGDLFICIHADNDGHPAGPFTVHRIVGHKYVGKGKRRHRVAVYESY